MHILFSPSRPQDQFQGTVPLKLYLMGGHSLKKQLTEVL